MARLCGRAGRLTDKNGGSRPLVPPPVWSTIYLLLQKVTSPRFTILNGGVPARRGQWSPNCTVAWSRSHEPLRSGPAGADQAPVYVVFPTVNRFCMVCLYGRAGRLTAQNGCFRPGQIKRKRPRLSSAASRTRGRATAHEACSSSEITRQPGFQQPRSDLPAQDFVTLTDAGHKARCGRRTWPARLEPGNCGCR